MRKFLCCFLAATTLLGGVLATVSCGGKGGGENSSASASIDVDKVTLKFTKEVYNIENEQTVTLEFSFAADGEELNPSLLRFESSDTGVATVSADGVVTGVSGGRAYITASYGEKTVGATINVTMREYRVALSDAQLLMLIGSERQITASVQYGLTDIDNPVLTWESSNPDVATVENGLVRAVGSGNTKITASYEGASQTVFVASVAETTAEEVNAFSEEAINVYGRSYKELGALKLDHAANGVEIGIIGDSLTMTMSSLAGGYMRVFVDGAATGEKMAVLSGKHEYTVASDLGEGLHTVRIVKCTEEQQNANWEIQSFAADKFFAMPVKSELKIEFIGDSITAGHGSVGEAGQGHTVDNSDATKTYAYLTAQALNADYSIVAYSGICTEAYHWVSNLNMKTLYNRVSNNNKQAYAFDFDADVVVLNLGTNEASYMETAAGGNYEGQFSIDYYEFLVTLRDKNPDAYIICLYGMMGQNRAVHLGIQQAVNAICDEKIIYNPFEINGNFDGGNGHPSALAHQQWGEDLTTYIQTLLCLDV